MLLNIIRVARLALQQFQRNLWLSIATVTLLILSLLSVNVIVGLGVVGKAANAAVQDKIDVSVYFKPSVSSEQAEAIRTALLELREVKAVEYIAREGSLQRFRQRHKDDPVIIESLTELGENPFGATLAIKAQDSRQYPRIVEFLEAEQYRELIEEKNFNDHEQAIAQINTFMRNLKSFGLVVAGIFGAIAILVVVNTVRVAVYTHRGEIRIMRLVGASSWFVRGPFLLEAAMFSLSATALTAALTYLGWWFADPYLKSLFDGLHLSLIDYYNVHAVTIFGAQLAGILSLTAVSSFFAVRRYLRV